MRLHQSPTSGSSQVVYAGDFLDISLKADVPVEGAAFLRTNYGGVSLHRREVIARVEKGQAILERDWRDLPMERIAAGEWHLRLALRECGVFEAKAYLVLLEGRRWVEGENARIKVEPALLSGDNTIYNAFIRQFGPNISGGAPEVAMREQEQSLNARGYTVVPPSGKFRDVRKHLSHIQDLLGFRFVMFLPVHPLPENFAKMGRFGSPFAPLDFFTVDSSMAEFDTRTTPLEQFVELVDAVHARGGRVLIDIPLDHTGWASAMQVHHPEWFLRNPDGSFLSPGAWGVTWADLCKLDFEQKSLWLRLADVLLHWCHYGVDGFRCDAGYMLPVKVWQYLTAKVKGIYPDTVFLLEGLGGPWEQTKALLGEGGMDWAYSESFQEFGLEAITGYLQHSVRASRERGLLVNFAETHDNSRLAAVSEEWARHRVAYSALTSCAGGFAMANGVEWLAAEKIDVHDSASLNWGAEKNMLSLISRLNRLLRLHPAFQGKASVTVPPWMTGRAMAILRSGGGGAVLCLVNPDMGNGAAVSWPISEFDCGEQPYELVSGVRWRMKVENGRYEVLLPAGAAICLSPEELPEMQEEGVLPLVTRQRWKEQLLTLTDVPFVSESAWENLAARFSVSPLELLRNTEELHFRRPVVHWRETDARRVVMVPPDAVLYMQLRQPFRAVLRRNGQDVRQEDSLPLAGGGHAVFFQQMASEGHWELAVTVYPREGRDVGTPVRLLGHLERVPVPSEAAVSFWIPSSELTELHTGLCTTDNGSYSLYHGCWGMLRSKYEGLLVVNPEPDYPAERRASLLRFRAWLRCLDFSHELALECQTGFHASLRNAARWEFEIPCGLGVSVRLEASWQLSRHAAQGRMSFAVFPMTDEACRLTERGELTLVVRPDVDARSQHEVTKAYLGAEQSFPAGVSCPARGVCCFAPGGAVPLRMDSSAGEFHISPWWQYQLPLPLEQERGLDSSMDVFSPGYFVLPLKKNFPVTLDVFAGARRDALPPTMPDLPRALPLGTALRESLPFFVVKRDAHSSVIAGYPWFLDWGRDTLICLRGLLAAGMTEIVEDTIVQFAQFEENGTLPNMIRGNDTGDRATSDAPLWLFETVRSYGRAVAGGSAILEKFCGVRRLGTILEQLAEAILRGCPNGVAADAESGLVFSPSHYTWMDTNYPAGTPRCGYPVEIQVLWWNALDFLAEFSPRTEYWREWAEKVRCNFRKLYVRPDGRGLVDCRHTPAVCPAKDAAADDAVRPNQLLAVTLGLLKDDQTLCRKILQATEELLIPGGIRSLADRPVAFPIPVEDNGRGLNDPWHPFWGQYAGDENTRRKPAYHNGTAWAWQMPLYCEAETMCLGPRAAAVGQARLASAARQMTRGCIGMLPEIYDGQAPHLPRGCAAQAWSMTEFYRVWKKLSDIADSPDNGKK